MTVGLMIARTFEKDMKGARVLGKLGIQARKKRD